MRHTAHFQAFIETQTGRRIAARLADVSLHGCCIHTHDEAIRQGAVLSVGMGDDSMLPAIVRWVRGRAAGMEFLRAVPSDQIEWNELMDLSLGI